MVAHHIRDIMDSSPLLKNPSFTQTKLGNQSMLKQAWLLFSTHKQTLLPGALHTALATLFAWLALSAFLTAEEPPLINFILLLVCVPAPVIRARQAAFTARTVLANSGGSTVRFRRLTLTSFLTTITSLVVLSLALFLLVVLPLFAWAWTATWGGERLQKLCFFHTQSLSFFSSGCIVGNLPVEPLLGREAPGPFSVGYAPRGWMG